MKSKKPQIPYSREVRDRVGIIERAFSSPNGKEALKLLCEEFHDGSTFDVDPYEMARKSGRREVVLFIMDLLNLVKRGVDDEFIPKI